MTAHEGDKNRVLHIYNVETLYAAVVRGLYRMADRTGRSGAPGGIWTRQNNAHADDNRGYLRTYAPQVTIAVVGKTLKKSCKFNAAARVLGDGAPRCSLAPLVEGYMRCLVGQLHRLARPEFGAGAGQPGARLPTHRTSRARQGTAPGLGGA